MSLLTKEQQDDVNTIKNYVLSSLPVHNDQSHDYRMLRHMCMRLLPIIDDLQARHIERKQYTENELYDIWLKAPGSETGDDPVSWDGALWAAKFLGALKAEP